MSFQTDVTDCAGDPSWGTGGSLCNQRRDFTIRRQIIWESDTASDTEVSQTEVDLIRQHRANDPPIGYNKWPRFKE